MSKSTYPEDMAAAHNAYIKHPDDKRVKAFYNEMFQLNTSKAQRNAYNRASFEKDFNTRFQASGSSFGSSKSVQEQLDEKLKEAGNILGSIKLTEPEPKPPASSGSSTGNGGKGKQGKHGKGKGKGKSGKGQRTTK